jgi:hypothetical protein
MSGLEPALSNDLLGDFTGAKPKTTVGDILGEHSALVNLDNLVQGKSSSLAASDGNAAKNPFTDQPNPFQAAAAPKPSMNQLMNQPNTNAGSGWPTTSQPATSPVFNPFF